jgi:surfeit locus 1 family protein
MAVADRSARPRRQLLLAAIALVLVGIFLALGSWQVQRRAWKLDLIARVEQRVRAAPVAAPGPQRWPEINRADDEYRHVAVTGSFLNDRETLVQAVTELGPGFWLLTPLRQADGRSVLVNRGFVPPTARDPAARGTPAPTGTVTVTGLLRLTEPGGGFLRRNDPAAGRWYSRDVQAIAAARGLADAAPYFIDGDAGATDPASDRAAVPRGTGRSWPAGGLTVIRFPNSHLVYAITWYALALMTAFGAGHVLRDERRRGRTGENEA